MSKVTYLSDAILAAGVPPGFTIRESAGVAVITYAPGTTDTQRATGDALVAGFDWSDAARAAREAGSNPERRTLRDLAANAVSANATFLALNSPSNARVLAQVRALTQQVNALIRRLVQID